MMKPIAALSFVALAALAARARAAPVALTEVGVTVDLDPAWQVTAGAADGSAPDRVSRDDLSVYLVRGDQGMSCADLLASKGSGETAVTSPPYLPSGFISTTYQREVDGATSADLCAEEPSGNLVAVVASTRPLDGERAEALRAMLDAVEQAVRADGNPHECVSGGGLRFWLPKRRWAVATAQHGDERADAVARLQPEHPSIRIIYREEDGVCEDQDVEGMQREHRVHSYAIEHAWSTEENGETTVMSCAKVANTGRVAIFEILVEGGLDGLDGSDATDVMEQIFDGMLRDDCRGDPTRFPPVSHRGAAARAPTPDPTPTAPPPTTPTTSPSTDPPAPTPPPTEVATAEPPPPSDTSAAASAASTDADADDDLPRKLRPTVQLAIAHSASSAPAGVSANGAAVELEAVDLGDHGGFAGAKEIALGLGWTAGVDFDARAGYGLAYRLGPIALAATAGIGVDGVGTVESGGELHDAGVLTYLGARGRLALGSVIVDGGVTLGSRTGHDETRWEAALSWQPRDDTGYGAGVSSISLENLGSATFVWVGVYPR